VRDFGVSLFDKARNARIETKTCAERRNEIAQVEATLLKRVSTAAVTFTAIRLNHL
jgi:hypothetical protein